MYKYFYKNLYKVKYGLFYLIDDNIFFINLKNSFCNKNIEILQGKCVINYLYKGFIYLWNNNEKLIFDINNSILKKHNNDTYPIKDVYSSKKEYYITYKENDIITLLEYNEGNYEEILENINFSFIIGDLFYDISNKIVCFNTEKTIWQYDLKTYFHQPAQIMEGRVLVSNNKIIFFAHTEDWSNYATFVLDAQTGQVLFTTQGMGMKLVEHNSLVYQIQRKAIKILDPKNLKIETIDVSTYCNEQSIFLDDHTVFFYKDKLYTLARGQGSDVYNILVVFNLKTQLFEHREDMFINPKKKKDEKNKMFINDIQANDNLVAIRCSDNLYVFEKQDVESK